MSWISKAILVCLPIEVISLVSLANNVNALSLILVNIFLVFLIISYYNEDYTAKMRFHENYLSTQRLIEYNDMFDIILPVSAIVINPLSK